MFFELMMMNIQATITVTIVIICGYIYHKTKSNRRIVKTKRHA